MTDIPSLVSTHATAFESCLLAPDPQQHIKTLPKSIQKDLLEFLLKPHDDKYASKLEQEHHLSRSLINKIEQWKAHSKIVQAKNSKEIKYIIEQFLKNHKSQFNYTRPVDYSAKHAHKANDIHRPPSVFPKVPTLADWANRKLKEDDNIFSQFSIAAIESLGEKVLKSLNVENKLHFLSIRSIYARFSDDFILKMIKQAYEEDKKSRYPRMNTYSILDNLTRSQFEKIEKSLPELEHSEHYLRMWFKISFDEQLDKFNKLSLTISQKDEKRKLLINILKEVRKKKSAKLRKVEEGIFKNILLLDIQREDVDKKMFLEFLDTEDLDSRLYNEKVRDKKAKSKKSMKVESMVDINFINDSNDSVIQRCINLLFRLPNAKETKKELLKYFQERVIERMYGKVSLEMGQSPKDLQKFFSNHEIQEMKDRKQITILETNRNAFKVEQPIDLKIKVKNIKNIYVKVYEVNTEKHYLESKADYIDEKQDVSYLHATHSYLNVIANTNPNKVENFDMRIEGIPEKSGVWLVEFEGEGITSRAFIQKGIISQICRENTLGVEVKFYDENGKQIKDLSVWMDGKKHLVANSFTIPYGQSPKNITLIAVKDSYAQKTSVYIPKQQFDFKIGYIYNSESFLVGTKAKIILHPRLTLQSNPNININYKMLEKMKISVAMKNNKNISSTLDFDNVKFRSDQDYVLEFPVQSYLNSVFIQVTGVIKLLNGKEQRINSNHMIGIQLGEDRNNFLDLYVRANKGNYILESLGLNGEKIPNLEVNVSYCPQGWSSTESVKLLTDENGQINLGTLQSISSITANASMKNQNISRSWNFKKKENQLLTVNSRTFFVGKEISIPVCGNEKCSLFRVYNNVRMEDFSVFCKIDKNFLRIDGIKEGQYELLFFKNQNTMNFRVIKGVQWEGNRIFNEESNMVYEIADNDSYLMVIGEQTIQKQGNDLLISVPIQTPKGNLHEKVRCHLIAKNYASPDIPCLFSPQPFRNEKQVKDDFFGVKECRYFNNKRLSEEASYVINRQNEKKYTGNNLEKPRMFLKRIEVRDTNVQEEHLLQQRSYNEPRMMSRMMNDMCMEKSSAMYGKRRLDHHYAPSQITSHNNFIATPVHIETNSKQSVAKFKIPQGYSFADIVILSDSTALMKQFALPSESPVSLKNVRHAGTAEGGEKSGWTMSREIYHLYPGDEIKVGRDSVWTAVGMQSIFDFVSMKGIKLQEWLTSWQTYSQKEKLKVYDENICHEINLYLKYKDPNFFEEIVRKFISNKITKTFVDYCLLEDKKALQWASFGKMQNLNAFETVLLIEALVKHGKKQEAEAIARMIENASKASSKNGGYQNFRQEFDTIIEAKLIQNMQKNGPMRKRKQQNQKQEIEMMMKNSEKEVDYEHQLENKSLECRMELQECEDECVALFDDCEDGEEDDFFFEERKQVKQPFKQVQKTKQYTETTYSGMKNPEDSTNLVNMSPFWVTAALHIATGSKFNYELFMYLKESTEFTLAVPFIPLNKNAEFDLSNEGQEIAIKAKDEFVVFVRELKLQPYEKKFGVLMNQRFFNPEDRYYFEEDGTQIEKQVTKFVKNRPYCVQTLATNTSGSSLQLQILMDIPSGSIPLQSHEYTQIRTLNLSPYTTQSFERNFYFPECGAFTLYPANACRASSVISKAIVSVEKVEVLEYEVDEKINSLEDALKSGDEKEILKYLGSKNIFDAKIFDPSSILWMLKDKKFYEQVIGMLRERKYYSPQIWVFGYLHHDLQTITEHELSTFSPSPSSNLQKIPIFEYFPYYSPRTHRFLNQNKSRIRNTQFRDNYYTFLFTSLYTEPTSPQARLTLIYYLLLQDRIDEAEKVLSYVGQPDRDQHRLQFDYIEGFIDMYKGAPSFETARTVARKYEGYQVQTWRRMFQQIALTLQEYDNETMVEEKQETTYETTVINEGPHLRISLPPKTQLQINIYTINLELYFSSYSFQPLSGFKPFTNCNRQIVLSAGEAREEKVLRDKGLKDVYVEVLEVREESKGEKKILKSFMWSNPELKVKLMEDVGAIQVFYQGRKSAGCYVKVYQMKGSARFYRDGYTDVTGTFKYALADLEGITQFSILVMSEDGGQVLIAKPPSQQRYL